MCVWEGQRKTEREGYLNTITCSQTSLQVKSFILWITDSYFTFLQHFTRLHNSLNELFNEHKLQRLCNLCWHVVWLPKCFPLQPAIELSWMFEIWMFSVQRMWTGRVTVWITSHGKYHVAIKLARGRTCRLPKWSLLQICCKKVFAFTFPL